MNRATLPSGEEAVTHMAGPMGQSKDHPDVYLPQLRTMMVVKEDVVTLALERIEKVFKRYDAVSVLFSGGKDSTVVLELALMVAEAMGKLPLDVIFFDEEAIQPETIDYVARRFRDPRVKMRWLCVPLKHLNATSPKQPFWFPWAPEDEAVWVRRPPWETHGIPRWTGKHGIESHGCIHPDLGPGWDRKPHAESAAWLYPDARIITASLLGMRAQESLRRTRNVLHRTYDNELGRNTGAGWVWNSKPIYDWRDEDVWSAPAAFGWDFNRAYDLMRMAGVSLHTQRVAPPFGSEPMQQLWTYGICWPELWEKMIHRVPGAATAAKYSRTPLYGFHGTVGGADESQDWKQAITKEIRKWQEPQRTMVATRIKAEIERHFSKTHDPVPDTEPHPDSGCCWSFFFMLAMRGDFKRRKDAQQHSTRLLDEAKARQVAKGPKVSQKTWED